jgi:hypothetical protein
MEATDHGWRKRRSDQARKDRVTSVPMAMPTAKPERKKYTSVICIENSFRKIPNWERGGG